MTCHFIIRIKQANIMITKIFVRCRANCNDCFWNRRTEFESLSNMSVGGIQSFQYGEFRPLDYRKSFFSHYALLVSPDKVPQLVLCLIILPAISINLNVPIYLGVFDLDYVLLFRQSHMAPCLYRCICKAN